MIEKTKLYHLSCAYLGVKPTFNPRIPSERYEGEQVFHNYTGQLIDEDDTIPRICVAESVENCLLAHPMNGMSDTTLYVYTAKDPYMVTKDLPAIMVPDAKETGETWILSDTVMEYQGKLIVLEYDKYEWISKTSLKKLADMAKEAKKKLRESLEKDLTKEEILV